MTGPLIIFSFVAICVIVSAWKRKKIEAMRHETARLFIEKNPAIDSAVLTQLLNPRPHAQDPRMVKVLGIIVIAIGLGLWLMGLWFVFAVGEVQALGLGGPATLIIVMGAGLIFAARFMPRPPAKDAKTGTYSEKSQNGLEL